MTLLDAYNIYFVAVTGVMSFSAFFYLLKSPRIDFYYAIFSLGLFLFLVAVSAQVFDVYFFDQGTTADRLLSYGHQTVFVIGYALMGLGLANWLPKLRRFNALSAKFERLAKTDGVTQLANRFAIVQELRKRIKDSDRNPFVAVFFDVTNFRIMNRALGFERGDMILSVVGGRLAAVFGTDTAIGRLGGDDFLVLPPRHWTQPELIARIDEALASVHQPMEVDGAQYRIACTSGLTDIEDPGAMEIAVIRDLQAACDRARISGARWRRHDGAAAESTRDLAIATDLSGALRNGEVYVVYQPVFDVAAGRMVGVEALCRWRHGALGAVRPDEFVPMAEKTGQIHELTRHVLRTVLGDLASLEPELYANVNISPINLLDETFFALVSELLTRTGVDRERVRLELTETAALMNDCELLDRVRRLSDDGFAVLIDDFGNGHSSLKRLHGGSFRGIKIDKSFIIGMERDEAARAIVTSCVHLARNAGLELVGEGVENRSVSAALLELGCPYQQGFGLGRPVPPQELVKFAPGAPGAID